MTSELKKILFVDDDSDMIMLAKYCLKSLAGVEIRYANSGEEALKEAPGFKPDLIVLDVMMPQMDGPKTLSLLRKLPETAATPVIFLTAKVQRHEIESYLKLGVIDVIIKPYDALALGETLRETWKKSLVNQKF